ncbi:3-oxoacyl-ACP synthase [Bacillus wiedmannii]|uniref:3-oxoacyl-ACP synthase n=1 Tax=Bacillus wiedmannii TaxID=1890302 RepID=A0A2A8CCI3_9BACI|nr:YolD-like family protein [Bacillus wiedmannii]PEL75540.1 3-oxoacyl-ACP synthase [Bacillus wiedmannii]PEM81521.1 3-oxoacyl-ACP synthase [Bacillus wiedmannii]PEO86087.1 3-oxoacyl-ACP synthase [Bacillus wiedmannii]PGD61730.1 3-oxoacyl-ACP synthase [Bacillus wiedmannii]PHG56792.1 3-oxoacyl-ACP synthase [Bacillus wiedmannii]
MNNVNMSKGRGMVKFTSFAGMSEQFAGIREIIKEKNKVTRPILTTKEKELIENMLLCSLLSEEEILITYYENGYILSSYMTVIDIDINNYPFLNISMIINEKDGMIYEVLSAGFHTNDAVGMI